MPPPKKVKQTDAIFSNLQQVHEQAASEAQTLRLSLIYALLDGVGSGKAYGFGLLTLAPPLSEER